MVVLGDVKKGTISEDNFGSDQTIYAKAMPPREPTNATAKREPAHSGGGGDAARYDKPMRLGCRVDLGKGGTATNPDAFGQCIHGNTVHSREVQHYRAIRHGGACNVVPPTPYADLATQLNRMGDCALHICWVLAQTDQRRTPVDCVNPHGPVCFVSGICGGYRNIRQLGGQGRRIVRVHDSA